MNPRCCSTYPQKLFTAIIHLLWQFHIKFECTNQHQCQETHWHFRDFCLAFDGRSYLGDDQCTSYYDRRTCSIKNGCKERTGHRA